MTLPLSRRGWLAAFLADDRLPAFFADDLLVAAASDLASLEPDLRRLAGGAVRFSFGSSGMLARQVENGAPFDVFLSADGARARALSKAGALLAPRVYAVGRVALWSKSGAFRTLDDLRLRPYRHLAMANPAHAPYGRAARQALERSRLWSAVEPRVVLAENVRQAWQFAESGNAEVCLTAWSLVYARGGLLVDRALHEPIQQVGGVVARSSRRRRAEAFLSALTGEEGRRVLLASGFE